MRLPLGVGLIVFALAVAPLSAQTVSTKVKRPAIVSSSTILANLQFEVNGTPFRKEMTFGELLDLAGNHLQKKGRPVILDLNEEAFYLLHPPNAMMTGEPGVRDWQIHLTRLPAKTTIMNVLREVTTWAQPKAAIIVRAGKVEIVPVELTAKEYMLNQTFSADFKDQRLDVALEELSELTGVTIVLDARAKAKTQTPVTARFRDDVALQDAVRMLADMADLKPVYLVTGLYVTTPNNAKMMEKELRQIYEPAPVMPLAFPIRPNAGPPPAPPEMSPLTPPLPPARYRIVEKAGA